MKSSVAIPDSAGYSRIATLFVTAKSVGTQSAASEISSGTGPLTIEKELVIDSGILLDIANNPRPLREIEPTVFFCTESGIANLVPGQKVSAPVKSDVASVNMHPYADEAFSTAEVTIMDP